jgi:hypothetical protein
VAPGAPSFDVKIEFHFIVFAGARQRARLSSAL